MIEVNNRFFCTKGSRKGAKGKRGGVRTFRQKGEAREKGDAWPDEVGCGFQRRKVKRLKGLAECSRTML